MKHTTATSASSLIQLRGILQSDISVLKEMELNTRNEEVKEFIASLVNAKDEILAKLPNEESSINSVPAPPEKNHIIGYNTFAIGDNDDVVSVMNSCREVEGNQMKYVQSSVAGEGTPVDLQSKLSEALDIYQKITDQIERSVKTQQANSINI